MRARLVIETRTASAVRLVQNRAETCFGRLNLKGQRKLPRARKLRSIAKLRKNVHLLGMGQEEIVHGIVELHRVEGGRDALRKLLWFRERTSASCKGDDRILKGEIVDVLQYDDKNEFGFWFSGGGESLILKIDSRSAKYLLFELMKKYALDPQDA